MSSIKYTSILFILMALSGCGGTYFTRACGGDHIGKYPYKAIVYDCHMVTNADECVIGIVSLLPDLVCDTILLPCDAVGWLFGLEKKFAP